MVRISIWAVNGCQSEVLVIRKFEIDCQGFLIGYDIEVLIPVLFIYNQAIFTRKATHPLWPVDRSFLLVS